MSDKLRPSIEIKREIAGQEKRREQLAAERVKASQANDGAQSDLIKSGSGAAMEKAAQSFAAFSSLQGALATIDAQLDEKRQALQEAEIYEGQAAIRVRVAECERELDHAASEYRQALLEAHSALETVLPRAYEARRRCSALSKELRQLVPASRYRGLEEIETENLGRAEFAYLISQGLQYLSNLERRGTRAERQTFLDERAKVMEEGDRRRDEERAAREHEAAKTDEAGWLRIAADRNAQTTA